MGIMKNSDAKHDEFQFFSGIDGGNIDISGRFSLHLIGNLYLIPLLP